MRGEVTKAGGINECVVLSRCTAFRSACVCREGKVSRTCVSHLEGSLLNDLHLFSDL